MGVKDTASLCNTLQAPSNVQGARCQTAVASRGTRRLLIYRSQQPITPGVKTGVSPNRQVVEYGDVSSPEYSLCVLCSRPLIHPRDTLPCVLAMLNSITAEVNIDTDRMSTTKQLPLEATREAVSTLPSPTEGQEAAAGSGPICSEAIACSERQTGVYRDIVQRAIQGSTRPEQPEIPRCTHGMAHNDVRMRPSSRAVPHMGRLSSRDAPCLGCCGRTAPAFAGDIL
ncbi:uncharacterized protein LOC125943012 [Dermacentor silvarum]|uniref:uncharacterized protein LOC125943012 n=1 Tax=Dermacentor silvarum TaxID=543639 RepID=UPI002101D319|nr:uncharacterized protein LOC125943012 [Dermacentor silvarum]